MARHLLIQTPLWSFRFSLLPNLSSLRSTGQLKTTLAPKTQSSLGSLSYLRLLFSWVQLVISIKQNHFTTSHSFSVSSKVKVTLCYRSQDTPLSPLLSQARCLSTLVTLKYVLGWAWASVQWSALWFSSTFSTKVPCTSSESWIWLEHSSVSFCCPMNWIKQYQKKSKKILRSRHYCRNHSMLEGTRLLGALSLQARQSCALCWPASSEQSTFSFGLGILPLFSSRNLGLQRPFLDSL